MSHDNVYDRLLPLRNLVSRIAEVVTNHGFISSILIFVIFWNLVSLSYHRTVLPNTIELLSSLFLIIQGGGHYAHLEHIPITLFRIIISLALVLPIGISLGVGMGLWIRFEDFLTPYVLISLAVPSIVWAFLAALWFGQTTYLVPIFATSLATFPYAVINAWKGTEDVDDQLIEMSRAFNANSLLQWRHIIIPQLYPVIFSTIRTVVGITWKVMLIAEVFGSQKGLGYVINIHFISQNNAMIFAWTIPVLFVILGVERSLQLIEGRMFAWRTNVDSQLRRG